MRRRCDQYGRGSVAANGTEFVDLEPGWGEELNAILDGKRVDKARRCM